MGGEPLQDRRLVRRPVAGFRQIFPSDGEVVERPADAAPVGGGAVPGQDRVVAAERGDPTEFFLPAVDVVLAQEQVDPVVDEILGDEDPVLGKPNGELDGASPPLTSWYSKPIPSIVSAPSVMTSLGTVSVAGTGVPSGSCPSPRAAMPCRTCASANTGTPNSREPV